MITTISNEALAIRKEVGAVELTVRTIVRTECSVLSNCVFHHASAIIHLRIKDLSTGPFVLRERCFVDVKNLIPSTHDVVLLQLFCQWLWIIADNVLSSDLGVVNRFKGSSDRHFVYQLLQIIIIEAPLYL